MVYMTTNRYVFGYIAVLNRERTCCIAYFPFLFKGNIATFSHVFFSQYAGALEKYFFLERLNAYPNSFCQCNFFVVELILNLANRRTERM